MSRFVSAVFRKVFHSSRPAALLAGLALLSAGCGYFQARMEMKKGNEYYNTKKYEQAVESYKKVLEYSPKYVDAKINLGLSYLALYQPGSIHEKDIAYSQGAIKAFKDALEGEPENERAKNFLIETAQKSNNHQVAIEFFEGEHGRHPDDVKTITVLGNLYQKIGDIDKALEWMQKRIDLEPGNPEAYYTMGVNCWARSFNRMDLELEPRMVILDRGIAAEEKAIELRPDYFEAYTYKNLLLRQKAAFDPDPAKRALYTQQADEFLKKALEIRNAQLQQATQQKSKAGGL